MNNDGSTFFRRAIVFLAHLKRGTYPNTTTLMREADISRKTADRVIKRLEFEYHCPIDYDLSRKGYYLTDPNYELPMSLPAGKDELMALLLACDLISTIGDEELQASLSALWAQFTASTSSVSRDLENLRQYFSCDSTVVADIADKGVLQYLNYAATGAIVKISYASPWKEEESSRDYFGRILKLHIQDGMPYLLFHLSSGKHIVLTAAFINAIEELQDPVELKPVPPEYAKPDWLEGFGIFAGLEQQTLEIHIRAPGSRYYAAQNWHDSQEDTWQGDILVRKIHSTISPEIIKRILSLGSLVTHVEPKELRQALAQEVEAMRDVYHVVG